MDWPKVQDLAMTFEPVRRRKWPAYLEEIGGEFVTHATSETMSDDADWMLGRPGIAEGAGVSLSDIITINVRTEITFGMFSDGCTALGWKTRDGSFLAQNWDWMEAQKENLIILTIEQQNKPTIKMVTEAGLIGKIGLNSAGVGVCLNAIKVKGMDSTRIPCHLGLRMVLESGSRDEAVRQLEKYGVASSCHMLVADGSGSIGLEWSAVELQKVKMNGREQVFHSNHYLAEHVGVEDSRWLEDSTFRVTKIEKLCEDFKDPPTTETLFELFKDEENYPGAICRAQVGTSGSASLFNIIMDLQHRTAAVTLGRPVAPEEVVQLAF
ncbi:hypothetical protein LTR33_003362 [Friedmanniomyces endolithicus]|nr:hypothetical protein LTR33_003362 [Friedmanniomyces endolithicus]